VIVTLARVCWSATEEGIAESGSAHAPAYARFVLRLVAFAVAFPFVLVMALPLAFARHDHGPDRRRTPR
jgi:hypothetical protein